MKREKNDRESGLFPKYGKENALPLNLLAIDIGNSYTRSAVFRGEKILSSWSLPTSGFRTVDNCVKSFREKVKGLVRVSDIPDVIISSVVPKLNNTFTKTVKELFRIEPMFVNARMETGLKINYDADALGADRIANAAACIHLYKGDVIIVDFGTATTFCVLTGQGEYEGGIIAPGIEISLNALVEKAALLPEIELCVPRELVGRNTPDSMRSGLVYGFTDLADGIVMRLKNEIVPDATVVATGGLVNLVSPLSRTINITDPLLTIKGLKILFDLNRSEFSR